MDFLCPADNADIAEKLFLRLFCSRANVIMLYEQKLNKLFKMLISFYFVVVSSLSGFMTLKLRLFYIRKEKVHSIRKKMYLCSAIQKLQNETEWRQ